MITTAILNDPKPARGINWAGHPMKDGEDYYGKQSKETPQKAPQTSVKASTTRRKRRSAGWTPEKRKALSERLKALWRDRHPERAGDIQSSAQAPQLPSVTADDA